MMLRLSRHVTARRHREAAGRDDPGVIKAGLSAED